MKTRAECLENMGQIILLKKNRRRRAVQSWKRNIFGEEICSGNCNVRIQISECGSNDEKCFLLSWINGHDTG